MLDQPVSTKKSTGEPPKIIEELKPEVGVVSNKVTLSCRVSGRPMPDITWTRFESLLIFLKMFTIFFDITAGCCFRFGKELKSGRKYKMSSEGQVNTLTIHNLSFDDDGIYSLTAHNNVGSCDTEARLIVEGNDQLPIAY